jgi:Tol biopolymer transport system component
MRTRRPILAAAALALLLVAAPLSADPPNPTSVSAAAASGRLLLPRFSGLYLLDPLTKMEQQLHAPGQVVVGAAWSPDGQRVAFAQFQRKAIDRYGSSDIYILDGDRAATAVSTSGPDQALNYPIWSGDGRALIYQVSGGGTDGFSIERALLDGTDRQTLEKAASAPSLSPDGTLLAFVRVTNMDTIMVRPLEGGEPREVLPADTFIAITSPRFSPDGQRLAFMAIGGPPSSAYEPAMRSSVANGWIPWARLGPRAARAHGLPWDPWVVNLDGSGLRQLSSLYADDPNLAWAPDGSAVAVFGGDGLWLVPETAGSPTLISHGGYGPFDWRQ